MDSVSVYKTLRLSKRDAAFLAIAIMLHGSLFLIPFKQLPSKQRHPQVVTLSLLAPPVQKPVFVEPQDPVPPPEISTPEPARKQELTEPLADLSEPEPELEVPLEPPDPVSTARLVDSASRLKWPVPKHEEQRRLGVHQPQEIPPNWRPSIRLDDNLFDGMTVPAETEVVDEWLASDGTHNVVINTPGGETLCGRKQAWDPMNPMIEHLMMFTSCGGGGKRTFKMPDRYMKRLVD